MSKTNGNFKKVFICLMAVVFAIGAAAIPAIAKKKYCKCIVKTRNQGGGI